MSDTQVQQNENAPLQNEAAPTSSDEITDYHVLNEMLSDDEDAETQGEKLDKFELIKNGDVQKLLMQIPPDFNLAYINGVSI